MLTTTTQKHSKSDLDLLAAIVHSEAGNQSDLGQQAVAQVVINRANKNWGGGTIKGVIYQKGQFSPAGKVSTAKPSKRAYENARIILNGARPIPCNVLFFSRGKAAGKKPYQKIGDHWFCYE